MCLMNLKNVVAWAGYDIWRSNGVLFFFCECFTRQRRVIADNKFVAGRRAFTKQVAFRTEKAVIMK